MLEWCPLRALTACLTCALFIGCSGADSPAATDVELVSDGAVASEDTPSTDGTASADVSETPRRANLDDTGQRGPHAISHLTTGVADAEDPERILPLEVWYPTLAAKGEVTNYVIGEMGGLKLEDASAYALHEQAVAPGTWPLIIFSHGYGAIRNQSLQLCETLASHGFIVASADHVGNTAADTFGGTAVDADTAAGHRPRDIKTLLDALTGPESVSPLIAGAIDSDRIGVTGHSFGGFTALAAAGGLASAGYGPDARVKAIAPISPGSTWLTNEDLARVDVPTLLLSGTLDTSTPTEPNVTRPYHTIAGRPRYRVDVHGATHTHFANICRIGALLIESGLTPDMWESVGAGQLLTVYEEACGQTAFPIAEAQRIQALYVVAFFRAHLAGEDDYAGYLTDTYASGCEPDVTFISDAEAVQAAPGCPGSLAE